MEKNSGLRDSEQDIPFIKGDDVDLVVLSRHMWTKRKVVYYSTGVFFIVGLLIALLSPVSYRSGAVLLPVTENKSSMAQLGGLAGLAGMDLSSMMGADSDLSPDLYPAIINSYPFIDELIHHPLNFNGFDHPISFYELEMADSISGWGKVLIDYTVRLPWTIKNNLSAGNDLSHLRGSNALFGFVQLNRRQISVYDKFKSQLSVSVDAKTNLISIHVEMKEPLVTAQVADQVIHNLQEYVIRYKTSQVRENLYFIEARFNEKKSEFELAQKALFAYRDRYRNVVAERVDPQFRELQDNYNILMSVYQDLAKQLEQARISVQKETPVFTVIEPVQVSSMKYKPRRSLIVVAFILTGVFFGIVFIIGGIFSRRFKKAWYEEDVSE